MEASQMGLAVLVPSVRGVNPIKRLLLICLAAQCSWGFSQNLILHPSEVPGVQLVGPQSPEFLPLIDGVLGPTRQPTTNDWLPYSVILTNQTEDKIVGIAIRWTTVDPIRKSTSTSGISHRRILLELHGNWHEPRVGVALALVRLWRYKSR
jgi:hypothetical protein